MKIRIIIVLLVALLLVFASSCAKDTNPNDSLSGSLTELPDPTESDNETIKELFERAAKKLILYATEEPSRVLNSDFDNKIEIDYSGEYKTINDRPYQKTNLNYQQAVNEYSKLFMGDALNEFLMKYFYDVDGVLYVTALGGASGLSIKNVEITFISKSNGEYLYKVTFDLFEHVESQFSVKKSGNDYIISSMDYAFGS